MAPIHSYVIASTLNQMVNLIPLLIDFQDIAIDSKIYNITLTGENGTKLEDNARWDDNFKKCLKELLPEKEFDIIDIAIQSNFLENLDDITKAIVPAIKGNLPLLWNITGGQRHYLFTINQVIHSLYEGAHKVFYLDGNHGKIYWMKESSSKKDYKLDTNKLKIIHALKLMGFTQAGYKNSGERTTGLGMQLWERYKEDETLRIAFIKSNKEDGTLEEVYNLLEDNVDLCNFIRQFESKKFPFGYILEEMVVDTIQKSCSGFLEIAHSAKIKFETGSVIDEFDILLLTRTGQVINFECKSGFMSSDVAKSTRYSTYAIGGVYGLPILITPLTKKEIQKVKSSNEPDYANIKASVMAAGRANLPCWGIDEIIENTKNKLNSTK